MTAPETPFDTDVLIVGAGPTGLTLAAALAARRIDATVIDRLAEGVTTSRAAVVHARTLRIQNAKAVPTICPYCAVGCGMIAHTINGQIVNIEGDPRSPHNEGTLCPKGAAIFQLHVNPNRPTQVLHRVAGAAGSPLEMSWALRLRADR